MRDLVRRLLSALQASTPLAYGRLVETRGSTPQKAGATMLVFADGSQQGTLGGGCVEAEVKRRALGLLEENRSEVCKFQLDSDYGWDDGLICGGRMQILVEPIAGSEESRRYFQSLAGRIDAGQGVTEAVVFDAATSGLPAPTSFLFDTAGTCLAFLHATDSPPVAVTDNLRPLTSRPRPYTHSGIAYLPVLPRCRLVIVGGGHVGRAVGDLAVQLDFDVWVADDREEYVSEQRFPLAQRRIAGNIEQVLPALEITPDTYCLIVTRGHNHDEEALFHLVNRGARYVGLIGSRRKIKMIFDDVQAEGISPESLAKVHAALGI